MKIPGISEIYCIHTSSLPALCREAYASGIMPLILPDLYRINVGPRATASDSRTYTPEGPEYKSVLSFVSSLLPFNAPVSFLAFVIRDAEGKSYLLGTKEPPFPKIKIDDNSSEPYEGKAGKFVTVEWEGPLIPCSCLFFESL